LLTYYVIAPVLIAAFLFLASTNNTARILAIFFQMALFIASVHLVLVTRDAEVFTFVGNYEGALGIVLRANHLSADFVFITTLIFLAISVYSYKEKRNMPLFWFLLFLMEASLIGLFLSGDLFNIFVLVEVSTTVTLILVMYSRGKRNMFNGMLFLMANVVAAQFYLFGLGYIYMVAGTLDIRLATEVLATLEPRAQILPYALIMSSVAFKCALLPFFSWSPKVRVYLGTPTVVQAVLSGLQVKSALYLFIRFQDVFQTVAIQEFFLVIGIISAVFGAFLAICQTNVRMILAYHTISQVGLIIVGISINHAYSNVGGLYHIFSHAVFKTTLFLSVGVIAHSYGTDDVYKIRGVLKRMPVVGVSAAAAVLGITGAPFFIGSVSKYFISYDIPPFLNVITVLISLGTIISFAKFSTMFFGNTDIQGDVPSPEKCKTVPISLLGSICLGGGVFGTQLIFFLFRHEVNMVLSSYIQKSLVFLISVGIGWLVYAHVIKGNEALKRFGGINFSFKSICAAIGCFMAVILVYFAVIG